MRQAGAFDGVLGVVMGVALVQRLAGRHLPVGLEVVGFSEEEGVRFGRPVPFSVMERAGAIGFVLVLVLFAVGLSNDIGKLNGSGFTTR